MNYFVVLVVILVPFGTCIDLPSGFKKCNMKKIDFNQCLGSAIHEAVRKLDSAITSHDLQSLYHVQFRPQDVMEFGNRSLSGLKQKFSNLSFLGLSRPEKTVARLDYENNTYTLTVSLTYRDILFQANYECAGTIVMLPLNAMTPVEVLMVNPTLTYIFKLEPYYKGTTYLRVLDATADGRTQGLRWNFKQLFENKHLNEEFNAAMTEKGAEIFTLYKFLESSFTPYFAFLLDSFLSKVSVAELFDGF